MNVGSYQAHPAAEILPLMEGADLQALAADIRANGLREPIWLYEMERGKRVVLDGRNRLRACVLAGVDPSFRVYEGDDPVAFVVSHNVPRRHLSVAQKAACAAEMLPLYEAEARTRQRHGATAPGRTLPESFPGAFDARDAAASQFHVNPHYVSDAKRIKEASPGLHELLRQDKITVPAAIKLASLPEDLRDRAVGHVGAGLSGAEAYRKAKAETIAAAEMERPSGKYRVIYADPPWSYGNSMPPGTGVPTDHYPAMELEEICALPVRDLALDDAVLFLWTTSPHLKESFRVIDAWGFTYKTSFVWDKILHNMGHYNSVRHEFLLVCTRGTCQPDVRKLFDSVHAEERREHSRKPDHFYEVIETIYPTGARVELFARREREGWSRWGYEAAA